MRDRAVRSGRPCLFVRADGETGLGGQIFLWEFATAVAGRLLGVNPFDQPDVASSKKRTMESLAEAVREGRIPMEAPDAASSRESVWAGFAAADAADALRRLAARRGVGRIRRVSGLPAAPAPRSGKRCAAWRSASKTAPGAPSPSISGPAFCTPRASSTKATPGGACSSNSPPTIPTI